MKPLEKEEAEEIIQSMATDKALSYDLFSDAMFREEFHDKAANLIRALWCKENLNKLDRKHFLARLIPINKKFPKISSPEDIRPIIVLSPLYKLLEARLLPKLRKYMINKLARSQVGFVPNMDITVNIQRALKRIHLRTDEGATAFCLFLDFKSAFNTIPHLSLFKKLQDILDPQEIQLLKALYARLTIKLGHEELNANVGVPQGSMISPALFNIFAESLLNKLIAEGWNYQDILALADDHLIICLSIEQVRKAITIVKAWCLETNIQLNPSKSGIVEMTPRRAKKTSMLGSNLEGIPVVESYKYLGLIMDKKLTGDQQVEAMLGKIRFLDRCLAPLLSRVSVDYRINLWKILIRPLFKPGIGIMFLNNKTRLLQLQRALKKSLKKLAGLHIRTPDILLEKLAPFDVKELSQEQTRMGIRDAI